jgi:hypothetical protein
MEQASGGISLAFTLDEWPVAAVFVQVLLEVVNEEVH